MRKKNLTDLTAAAVKDILPLLCDDCKKSLQSAKVQKKIVQSAKVQKKIVQSAEVQNANLHGAEKSLHGAEMQIAKSAKVQKKVVQNIGVDFGDCFKDVDFGNWSDIDLTWKPDVFFFDWHKWKRNETKSPEQVLDELHKSVDLSLQEIDPEKKLILNKEQENLLQELDHALKNM